MSNRTQPPRPAPAADFWLPCELVDEDPDLGTPADQDLVVEAVDDLDPQQDDARILALAERYCGGGL